MLRPELRYQREYTDTVRVFYRKLVFEMCNLCDFLAVGEGVNCNYFYDLPPALHHQGIQSSCLPSAQDLAGKKMPLTEKGLRNAQDSGVVGGAFLVVQWLGLCPFTAGG